VIAQLNRDELQRVAASSGGIYRDMSFDDRDISAILNHLGQGASGETRPLEREFDLWSDAGPWLVLLLLPLAALSHRRGWLVLILLMPMSVPDNAYALGWEDLWLNKNQQGAKALQRGETEAAAQLFDRPQWRGSAQYLNGDYEQAAISFLQTDDTYAHYNRGNALAHAGELESALQAFDKALELEPGMDDAEFNRQLVQQLLDQQQQSEGEGEDSGKQDRQNADQQDPDQENQSQQGTDHQNANQNSSDPSSSADNGKPQDQAASNPSKTPAEQSDEQSNKPAQNKTQPSDQTENRSEPPQQTPQESTGQSTQARDAQNETLDKTQDASLEKWLQQLPEDPGGLLRRKFDYEYRQKLEAYRRGDWQPADETRW
jgi:Ca-activated chloride channel family protein